MYSYVIFFRMHILKNSRLLWLPKLPTVAHTKKSLPPTWQHQLPSSLWMIDQQTRSKTQCNNFLFLMAPKTPTLWKTSDSSHICTIWMLTNSFGTKNTREVDSTGWTRTLTTTTRMAEEGLDSCHRDKKTEGKESMGEKESTINLEIKLWRKCWNWNDKTGKIRNYPCETTGTLKHFPVNHLLPHEMKRNQGNNQLIISGRGIVGIAVWGDEAILQAISKQ